MFGGSCRIRLCADRPKKIESTPSSWPQALDCACTRLLIGLERSVRLAHRAITVTSLLKEPPIVRMQRFELRKGGERIGYAPEIALADGNEVEDIPVFGDPRCSSVWAIASARANWFCLQKCRALAALRSRYGMEADWAPLLP